MAEFQRDPNDWLRRLSPDEWIRAALGELARAEQALETKNLRAAIAGVKRAAGMALNGALIVEPNDGWGRTYVEHVAALAKDADAPEAVKRAAEIVASAAPPSTTLVALRTPSHDEKIIEAAKDVIAHAYAVVKRHEAKV
jgi:HEPN domain-containing protein